MKYEHTQAGYLIIFVFLAIVLLFGFVISQSGLNYYIIALMIFILLLLGSFSTLKVMINKDHLRIKFGYGIYSKRLPLKEIISAKIVRNHWYYGWGIRLWLWPTMMIFNVSGFDAVEIKTKKGKIYRIGTDEPKKLENAILKSINLKPENN